MSIGANASFRCAFMLVLNTGTVFSKKKFLSIASLLPVTPEEIAPKIVFAPAPPTTVVARLSPNSVISVRKLTDHDCRCFRNALGELFRSLKSQER